MFRTSNPALRPEAFREAQGYGGEVMTISGAVNKCFILLALIALSASWIWGKMMSAPLAEYGAAPINVSFQGYVVFGAVAGFVLALVTIFKKEWARITAPLYALCEGLVLGGISALYQYQYGGIVLQAVGLTLAVTVTMLVIYQTRLIQVDQKFLMGLSMAMGGLLIVYLCNWIFMFFGRELSFIYSSSPMGIIFSLFVCALAAFNLLVDFWVIEEGARQGAPKHMEWYAAFGLMVTLVWLYLEILRLLAKARRR